MNVKKKLESILIQTRNSTTNAPSGYISRIDDSRFARTGFNDEREWEVYKSILYSEGIQVERMSYTGLDSSIRIKVL